MRKITAFGDSVLMGVVLDNDKYRLTKNSFVSLLKDKLDLEIDNNARFGLTATAGEALFDRCRDKLISSGSEYVVLEFGGNDCDFNWGEISENPNGEHMSNTTIKAFVGAYNSMIEKIVAMGKKPLLLSLPPIDARLYFDYVSQGRASDKLLSWLGGNIQFIADWHERYNIEVFKTAIKNNIPIIDITSPFLMQKNSRDFLCADGIHPNDNGHRLIADAISRCIV